MRSARPVAWPTPRPPLPATLLLLLGWLFVTATAAHGETASILGTRLEGTVTPVMADHLRDAIRAAVDEGHVALLVEMDTPGGLDSSMREIVKEFLEAPLPVVVHVAPQGARAASAGAIIAFAAHVAAMAPGTAIGAATPIDLQGGDLERKVINDAAAYAEAIAALRGRSVEFAVDAVREGRSASAEEAERIGAVDLIARDRAELLRRLDGRTVTLAGGETVTLRTAGAEVVDRDLGFARGVLQWLADPNIAFLFLSLGTLAILYELANPGVGAAGIVGVLMLPLGLFSLAVLPVNALGGILLLLGLVLLVAEVFTPGVGVFAAGGTVSLILGGLFLFRGALGVDLGVLIPSAVVVGGGTMLAARLAWRARRPPHGRRGGRDRPARRGSRVGRGRRAGVVDGAWWNARSTGGPLEVGRHIRVVDMDGLELVVEPETTHQQVREEVRAE